MPSLQRFMDAMRWAADSDRVGYSQSDRYSLAASDFFGGGWYNTDCSALVIAALQHAGFDTGFATYTGNMSANLCARGWVRLPADGNPQPGDILLSDANHVAAWLGECLAQASIDEHGNIACGARGDQTGREVNTRSYYNYPWDCHLRYVGPVDEDRPEPEPKPKKEEPHMPTKVHPAVRKTVYRVYDDATGEHMYPSSKTERDQLVKAGWSDEGELCSLKAGGTVPVYRLYQPGGKHLLTADYREACALVSGGWVDEGVRFWGHASGKPVYRLYRAADGDHLLTTSKQERASAKKLGYAYEGVAFRA